MSCEGFFFVYLRNSPLYKGHVAERATGFNPHENSTSHQVYLKKKKSESETPAVLAGVHVNCDMDAGFKKQMENMFHTAYYVVKKEKQFTDWMQRRLFWAGGSQGPEADAQPGYTAWASGGGRKKSTNRGGDGGRTDCAWVMQHCLHFWFM